MNPAEWFLVTGRMYWRVFREAAALSLANWPVLATLSIYSAIMAVTLRVAGMISLAGGFLFGLVWAACAGSFLYLVEMIVRTSKVSINDFRSSFGQYVLDVLGVSFISWIFFMIVAPALLSMPNGLMLMLFVQFVLFVLFNAVPELIYLGHFSSMGLLSESYAFITVNWIEWFPANLLALGLVYAIWRLPVEGLLQYVQLAFLNLAIYFVAVTRGILFIELYNSNSRSRAFKYRSGG